MAIEHDDQELTAATTAFGTFRDILDDLKAIDPENEDEVADFLTTWGSKNIVGVLRLADDAYYNDGREYRLTPKQLEVVRRIFDDVTYDAIFDALKKKFPRNPYVSKIGAPVTKAKGKVALPFHMGSLDKIKPDGSAEAWLEANPGPYVISDKEDGNSGGFTSDGNIKQLYSRGDGTQGQLISHLIPHIRDFPKKLPKIWGRGELIMSESRFRKYEEEKANARNHVAGIANSNEVNPAIKDVDFLAYEIVKPRMKPSDQFKKLEALGFDTPWHRTYQSLTSEKLVAILEERRKKSPYRIDGLVVTLDKLNPVNTSGNPDYSVSFKMTSADSIVTATVKGVTWQLSKHGYLKPVVNIEPVKLSGVTISRTTGFNAKFIADNKIGKGARIKITRSGDVIPHILEVLKPAKAADLPKDKDWEWTESGVDIFVPNAEDIEEFQITRITNFFRVLGVKDVSSGIIGRLYEAGLNSIPKIIKANLRKLQTAEGVKERTASTIRSQIDDAINKCLLSDLMYGSGCFSRELGSTRFASICKALPRVLTMKPEAVERAVLELPGFSTKTTNAFMRGLPDFKKFLNTLPDTVTYIVPKEKKPASSKLAGLFVVFTGFRDADLAEVVKSNGGVYADSLTGKVNMLVVKSAGSSSSKVKTAKSKGIEILTRDEFIKFLKSKKVL